jgi:hypothetical protein
MADRTEYPDAVVGDGKGMSPIIYSDGTFGRTGTDPVFRW